MKEVSFYKAHGTGNDFIIFIEKNFPKKLFEPHFIKKICNRKTGIGADGVIFTKLISSDLFEIEYYNSDGTWETFCANGSRCVGKILIQNGLIENNSTFNAGDGEHTLKVENNIVWIKTKPPIFKTNEINCYGYTGKHIDSGAKHFVTIVNNLTLENVKKFGPKIRYSKIFKPLGLNVNFSKKISNNKIKVITYEKGIEEVVLSCGSGSVASAYYIYKSLSLQSPLKIEVLGGELNLKFNESWDDVWLGGPAVIVFKSKLRFNNIDICDYQ